LINNTPLISIVTVVYNGEKYLEQTIQSVINQTYKNIEYIIIDGGSTDGTLEIVKKYSEHISYWVSEPDKGLYDAMNKGIGIAKGKIIGIVNSDDWYELDTIDNVVNNYLKYPDKKIFHGDMNIINELNEKKLHKFNPSEFKLKYYGTTYNHPTFFVTNDEYVEHIYNNSLRSVADVQFTLEAFLKDKSKFLYINKPLSNFRLGGTSGNLSKIQALKEGYAARQNAGFSLIQNIFTIFMRLSYWQLSSLVNLFKEKK
jgi:glycosyltransferase involved in cell wall biosynthesis